MITIEIQNNKEFENFFRQVKISHFNAKIRYIFFSHYILSSYVIVCWFVPPVFLTVFNYISTDGAGTVVMLTAAFLSTVCKLALSRVLFPQLHMMKLIINCTRLLRIPKKWAKIETK